MPESVYMGQLHLNKACWELWLSVDLPHSDYNGQWQKALGMVEIMQSSQPNPHRNKKWKMYAMKQIKICAEYRDMLPRPRMDLSGTPGLRPIGLSPGSWQTCILLLDWLQKPEILAYKISHDQSTLATNPVQDSIWIIVAHIEVFTCLGTELLHRWIVIKT